MWKCEDDCVPVKFYFPKTSGGPDLALSPNGTRAVPGGRSTNDGLGKNKDEELLGFVTTCRD